MKKILFVLLLFVCTSAVAQNDKNATAMANLKRDILKMDSLLFNVAFNNCNIDLFKNILSEDVEFYDDRSGLGTSKENEIKSLAQKCAQKDSLTRKLNTTVIDKLGDFGALQLGEHTFYLNGVPEGTGKFVHIWERRGDKWQLKRIVSYEHRPIKKVLKSD